MKYSKLNIFYFLCILFSISVVSYELIFMKKYVDDISNSSAIFPESKILTQLYQSKMERFKTEQTNISEKKIAILWIQIYEIFTCFLISLIFISKKIRKIIFKKLNEDARADLSFLTLRNTEISYFSLFLFLIFISKTINCLLYDKKIGFGETGVGSQIYQLIHLVISLPLICLLISSLFLKYCKRKYIYILIITIILVIYLGIYFKQMGDPIIANFDKLDITTLDDKIQEVITKLNLENDIFINKKDDFFVNAYFAQNFVTKRIILYGEIFRRNFFVQGILSHELGHAMDGKILLSTFLTIEILICIFVLFFVDCVISKYFVDEDVSRDCSTSILFLLYVCYFNVFLQPIKNISSQIFEFRADSFAKSLSQHIPLAESLFLISIDKNSFVSSKLYNILLSTHPSIYDRIKNFDKD